MNIILFGTVEFVTIIPYDIVCHRDGDSNPNIVDDVHPNTSFAAISNGRNVTAVFTEGAHECAKFGDDTLAFTLVRSTGVIDRYCGAQWQCPENQCLREISGRCAIYVGTCDEAAELLALSAQFRNPLLCHVTPCDTTKFTGGRPAVQDTKITELFYKVDKYQKAMNYFKTALDMNDYNEALTRYREELLGDWFLLIPLAVILFIALIYFLFVRIKKFNEGTSPKKRTLLGELSYAGHIVFHPFDGFWDAKHEKRGSVKAALIFMSIAAV